MSRERLILRNGRWINLLADEHLRRRRSVAPMVISDLAEYRAAAADKHTGKRPLIGGRRQHREFLKRNGYAEVGNDYVAPRREELPTADRVSDIRRALCD